jgi:cyclase
MSGKMECQIDGLDFIEKLEGLGAGEVLLQSIQRDGTLNSMDFERIATVCSLTKLPVIASGGAASVEDCFLAVQNGASAVSAGALFQFTEVTPKQVRNFLTSKGIRTRVLA